MSFGVLSDITGIGAIKRWTPLDIPSQFNKVWIVTGGHAGIGLSTTRELGLAGATVYLAGRNQIKVEESIKRLEGDHPSLIGRLHYLPLDLANLSSAQSTGQSFLKNEKRLDGIICNAGVMAVDFELTKVRS